MIDAYVYKLIISGLNLISKPRFLVIVVREPSMHNGRLYVHNYFKTIRSQLYTKMFRLRLTDVGATTINYYCRVPNTRELEGLMGFIYLREEK